MQNLPLYYKWSSRSHLTPGSFLISEKKQICLPSSKKETSQTLQIIARYLSRVLCKVLEHIVVSNLNKHLANSNILFGLQHEFREKRSCETQLVMPVDEIAKNMQMGKQTDLIL